MLQEKIFLYRERVPTQPAPQTAFKSKCNRAPWFDGGSWPRVRFSLIIGNSLGARLDANECVKYLAQWRIAIR